MTQRFTFLNYDGGPQESTDVSNQSFFVGPNVVTPVFEGGLVALGGTSSFDDRAGTVDTVEGRAALVR